MLWCVCISIYTHTHTPPSLHLSFSTFIHLLPHTVSSQKNKKMATNRKRESCQLLPLLGLPWWSAAYASGGTVITLQWSANSQCVKEYIMVVWVSVCVYLLCGRGHWCWRLWWRSRMGMHRSQRTCGSQCPQTPGRAARRGKSRIVVTHYK